MIQSVLHAYGQMAHPSVWFYEVFLHTGFLLQLRYAWDRIELTSARFWIDTPYCAVTILQLKEMDRTELVQRSYL